MSNVRHRNPEQAEHEELRRVAMLLRGLPDPEPPPELTAQVMERIGRDGRRGVVRGMFRRASEPRFGMALAAGVAGLLFYGAVQRGALPLTFKTHDGPPVATADKVREAPRTAEAPPLRRIATNVSGSAISPVVYFGGPDPSALALAMNASTSDSPDRNLDRQLNRLLLDPRAFVSRLQNVSAREHFVARLAERSARRGDAAEVALHLRRTAHPEADQVSDRFLQAALVRTVSTR